MALVAYSDSEESDNEAIPAPPPKSAIANAKLAPSFQKTEARKIKVDLPTLRPEASQSSDNGDDIDGPPAKRARTGGIFGGFNALLPAPKRAVEKKASLGKGVSLKTSSEAAFSRAPPAVQDPDMNDERHTQTQASEGYDEFGNRVEKPPAGVSSMDHEKGGGVTEVKIIGKATRFRPLSVANKKKEPKKKVDVSSAEARKPPSADGTATRSVSISQADIALIPEPKPKPKRSLFSVQHDDPVDEETLPADDYDNLATPNNEEDLPHSQTYESAAHHIATSQFPANTLEAVAADLNLTPAQRRQLLGRNSNNKNRGPSIAHFNMDNEYRANEQIRQSGETEQHRAVKSIAPGKHSLQQLVNNARSNQDSIEDKWAEGKRNRSEGGSKYGF